MFWVGAGGVIWQLLADATRRRARKPSSGALRNQKSGRFQAFRNAPGRIRTYDLPLRRRTLYPLSYGRVRGEISVPWAGA